MAEVDLSYDYPVSSRVSIVTEETKMDSKSITSHVLVKSGVVYCKPAKTLLKVTCSVSIYAIHAAIRIMCMYVHDHIYVHQYIYTGIHTYHCI